MAGRHLSVNPRRWSWRPDGVQPARAYQDGAWDSEPAAGRSRDFPGIVDEPTFAASICLPAPEVPPEPTSGRTCGAQSEASLCQT